MSRFIAASWLGTIVLVITSTGCKTYEGQGAAMGGLGGAGIGALVGSATGHAGAGAAIGAVAGALGGAAIGSGMDDIEAKNRAQIAATMNRPIPASAVSVVDVVNMTHAGVAEELIVSHVRSHGTNVMLQSQDLIYLQQQGVSPRVVQAMQDTGIRPVVYQAQATQPVYVERVYDPYWGPYYHHGYYRHCEPGMSWGVTVRN